MKRRQHSVYRWRRLLIGLAILSVIVGGLAVVLQNPQWTALADTSCVEEGRDACSPDIRAELSQLRGQPLWFTLNHKKNIEEKILAADRSIKQADLRVSVLKRFLSVRLVPRSPVAQIFPSDQPNRSYLVDDEGVVYAATEPTSLMPALIQESITDAALGSRVSPTMMQMIHFVLAVHDEMREVVLFQMRAPDLVTKLASGTEIIFTPDVDASQQVRTLQLVLDEARIEHTTYEKVDVRFTQPIVTKK